jgi:hypothetical protein
VLYNEGHLPGSDLILKFLIFFLFELIPFRRTKWFPFNARTTESTKNLSIIVLRLIL